VLQTLKCSFIPVDIEPDYHLLILNLIMEQTSHEALKAQAKDVAEYTFEPVLMKAQSGHTYLQLVPLGSAVIVGVCKQAS
jgi:hypothetical protein